MNARGWLHREYAIGQSDGRLFGGFIEHIGRCVYDGIYEPGHPAADADGFREDVLELVRGLRMPLTRYPGGNFVSGYDWRNGIGPKTDRKPHFDQAWQTLESNQFGLDEFVRWCAKAGTSPMLTLNLGTGTPTDALELLEYCNTSSGTPWSERRRQNGAERPYNVRVWCLGNEMSSERQIGHKSAAEYGQLAAETAGLLKKVDPSLELVVCGSSCRSAATFAVWDARVLEATFDLVDAISLHAYFGCRNGNLREYMASDEILGRQIQDMAAVTDFVAAEKKSSRRIGLSLDEWNVWSGTNTNGIPTASDFEDVYNVTDALVVGGLLMTMLEHSDRLRIACLAQTCNIIAPIMTRPGGGAWRQTIYHPFALTSQYGRGTVLRMALDSPCYRCDSCAEPVRSLKAVAVFRKDKGEIALFLLNREPDAFIDFQLEFTGFIPEKIVEAIEIHSDNPDAVNTESMENVTPGPLADVIITGSNLTVRLKPLSWNLIRIAVV